MLKMRFREICQRAATLLGRLLRGTVEHTTQYQDLKAGNNKSELHNRRSRTSASMRLNTAITSISNASPEKTPGAGDIARSLLVPDSVCSISNVLVVGRQGSTPMKRMEMRFHDPKQVPELFGLLAAALRASGFELKAAPLADIPANEIWLTCSLDGEKRILLCCAATIAEHVPPAIAVIPTMHEAGRDNRATQL